MAGQGSAGNVIAALASFFIPGLGQLVQGRVFAALFFFVLSGAIWLMAISSTVESVGATGAESSCVCFVGGYGNADGKGAAETMVAG